MENQVSLMDPSSMYVSSPKKSVYALRETADQCPFFQETVEEVKALAFCRNPCGWVQKYNSVGHQQQGYADLLNQLQMCWVSLSLENLCSWP